jgi:hypothetical protein
MSRVTKIHVLGLIAFITVINEFFIEDSIDLFISSCHVQLAECVDSPPAFPALLLPKAFSDFGIKVCSEEIDVADEEIFC